jgi:hypothetical protein
MNLLPKTRAWRRQRDWEDGTTMARWAMGLGVFACFMALISAALRALGA